jgi:tetratricopeptide (TPR) repeat protein
MRQPERCAAAAALALRAVLLLACAASLDARAKKGGAKKARRQPTGAEGGGAQLPGLGGAAPAAAAGDYAAIGARASSFSAEGRHDEAVHGMRSAVALRPEVPNGHYNLGVVCTAAGRHAEALPSLRRAQQLASARRQPGDPVVFLAAVGVASAQYELGEHAEALEAFATARQLATSESGRLQVEEGHAAALLKLERYEEAVDAYTTAARMARDPRSQQPGTGGPAAAALRNAQEAISALELAEAKANAAGAAGGNLQSDLDPPAALKALEESLGGPGESSRSARAAPAGLSDVLNSWWASDAKVVGAHCVDCVHCLLDFDG